jgi:hypothetical protein
MSLQAASKAATESAMERLRLAMGWG